MESNQKPASPQRRSIITNTLKIGLLGTILPPLIQSCNNKKTKTTQEEQKPKITSPKKSHAGSKKKRQKWSHESLMVNSKSGVMHLPSAKVYHYYDEIKANHIKDISIGAWASTLTDTVRVNKQHSGNIFEVLTLQQLQRGVDDASLAAAIETLSTAFKDSMNTKNSMNLNTTNFRLHELLLQLISLNNSIPAESKWHTFTEKIKMPGSLRKRQQWMANESNFMERVNYITQRRNDYISRIGKRAAIYNFT